MPISARNKGVWADLDIFYLLKKTLNFVKRGVFELKLGKDFGAILGKKLWFFVEN